MNDKTTRLSAFIKVSISAFLAPLCSCRSILPAHCDGGVFDQLHKLNKLRRSINPLLFRAKKIFHYFQLTIKFIGTVNLLADYVSIFE